MYQLAQVNIAKMLAPLDDPIMANFVDNLDRINILAEKYSGFVWRLKHEDDDTEAIDAFVDNMFIINMSVWEDIESLFEFTYKSDHVEIFKRRKEWFSNIKEMHMVFWYVPAGHEPTHQEAKQRLDYLNEKGATPYAFTFKNKYTMEEFLNYKP